MSLQATKQGQCFDFAQQGSAAEKPSRHAGRRKGHGWARVTAGPGFIGRAGAEKGPVCRSSAEGKESTGGSLGC